MYHKSGIYTLANNTVCGQRHAYFDHMVLALMADLASLDRAWWENNNLVRPWLLNGKLPPQLSNFRQVSPALLFNSCVVLKDLSHVDTLLADVHLLHSPSSSRRWVSPPLHPVVTPRSQPLGSCSASFPARRQPWSRDSSLGRCSSELPWSACSESHRVPRTTEQFWQYPQHTR